MKLHPAFLVRSSHVLKLVPGNGDLVRETIQRRRELAALPRRFVLDVICLITGKGKPWTKPDSELVLKDP